MNDRGGNGAGCFDIKEWADTTEYLESAVIWSEKDEAKIASRVGSFVSWQVVV